MTAYLDQIVAATRRRLSQGRGTANLLQLEEAASKHVPRGFRRVLQAKAKTDVEVFQGSLDNLRLASTATQLPCLRKDFIIDEIQIVEARAHQADAVLLI